VDGDLVSLAKGGPSALVFGQVAVRTVPDIHRNLNIFSALVDRYRPVAKARHCRGLHGKIQEEAAGINYAYWRMAQPKGIV
jgi:hypothetical protein